MFVHYSCLSFLFPFALLYIVASSLAGLQRSFSGSSLSSNAPFRLCRIALASPLLSFFRLHTPELAFHFPSRIYWRSASLFVNWLGVRIALLPPSYEAQYLKDDIMVVNSRNEYSFSVMHS